MTYEKSATRKRADAALGFLPITFGPAIVPVAILASFGAPNPAAARGAGILPIALSLPGSFPSIAQLARPTRPVSSARTSGPMPDGTPIAAMQAEPAVPATTSPAASIDTAPPPPPAPAPPVTVTPAAAAPGTTTDVAHPAEPAAEDTPIGSSADIVAQPPESLRDAIVESLKGNPDIQIALAQQDDARFGVDEARSAYFPHLDTTVTYGREITKQGTLPTTKRWRTDGSVTLNQNVWDFGTTINDIKRARASYKAAQWGTRERIEAISYDIANAYLGLLQQQKLIALSEEEIAANNKVLRMVTVQKDLGLTTQADVDRAKARLENVNSTLLDRRSGLQQARDGYRRLTDREPGRAVEIGSSASALPPTVEAAVDMIDDHSPRLAQSVQDRRSLAKQYASQTGTFFPRIGVQVQGNHKYDVLGVTGLSEDARAVVTVSYSFLNGGADVAIRRRIGARLRQADYEVDRRRREVEQDIRVDFQALRAAQDKIATINSEIASASRVADLYKQQFREGRRSVFDLLDTQQVLYTARANAVVNETAMHAAEYRVLQKLGGLFDLISAGEPLPHLSVPIAEQKKPMADPK